SCLVPPRQRTAANPCRRPVQPIRLVAKTRPKIAASADIAVIACRSVSVSADPSSPSTGSPKRLAAAVATEISDAHIGRARYQGFEPVMKSSFLLGVVIGSVL